MWNAVQYVGTGLSLIAFVVAAIVFAYRAHLKRRVEIIKSAPEKERLDAIAATAEFFRVDVSGLSRAQQQDIIIAQIHARARRDLLATGLILGLAVLLAVVAVVAIVLDKSTPPGPDHFPNGAVLKRVPTPGVLTPGTKVFVDDGSCAPDMIMRIISGQVERGILRKTDCVPRRCVGDLNALGC
ncbi:MAG TPA: DUF6719 family protein [Candidatus Acidoferrum sp.]|nr:DUF6719 family protein [Candidatus Acidoferrum sp.]